MKYIGIFQQKHKHYCDSMFVLIWYSPLFGHFKPTNDYIPK